MQTVTGYKILTHDWRAPLQGGPAVCDGVLPITLPAVTLDRSSADCGAGWNFCASLVDAAKIAGYWPNGRPSRCLVVEPVGEVIARTTKSRAAQLNLVRLCTESEIQASMRALVSPWAGAAHMEGLVAEQWAWYIALGRPLSDEATVQGALRAALDARGLSDWQIKRFDAARAARAAWAAWDAWAALAVYTTASHGWLKGYKADHLTVGIRDAYHHGLGIAMPTGPKTLGYSLDVDG